MVHCAVLEMGLSASPRTPIGLGDPDRHAGFSDRHRAAGERREEGLAGLGEVVRNLGPAGASERTAELVLELAEGESRSD